MVSERTLDGLTVKMIVGVSSRCRDPAEVSGTFWNLSLICKICSSLHVLIGLQSNKCSSSDVTHNGTRLYSIPNKCSSYMDNEH